MTVVDIAGQWSKDMNELSESVREMLRKADKGYPYPVVVGGLAKAITTISQRQMDDPDIQGPAYQIIQQVKYHAIRMLATLAIEEPTDDG